MYKVFLNDRLIRIDASENITFNKTPVVFKDSCTSEDIKTWVQSFIKDDANEVILIHSDPHSFFRLFQNAFINIGAAGGVVVSGDKLLFIFRKGKWDLPKGKMEAGEQPEDAALREVEEETGITGHRIAEQLPDTFHIYQSPYTDSEGQWILKKTFWFEMHYEGELRGVPQEKEGITLVRWFLRNELEEVLSNTYENLKQIIHLYIV
jgi:8-oxo-dGTP pyrophosphatase MutT (NUDIX family)